MIDEKKLIEKINEMTFEVEVVSGKYRAFKKVVTLNNVKRIIADQPKVGEWIPVSERLPENDEKVLVSCQSKKGVRSCNLAYYWNGCWHGVGSMAGVVAWQPLPEPFCGAKMDGEEE